jgi:hypothetical protein
MLGNISTAERPGQTLIKEGKTAPIRARPARRGIAIRVTFEENRLAAAYLATAYEQVVPLRRRSSATARPSSWGGQTEQPIERTGA